MRVLRKDDLLRTVKTLIELKDGRGQIDDIDNLGNRRVRSVGELMENQYRIGLLRMERAIRERMGCGRHRHGDAARPDQRQAGGGGGARILRLQPALAVHGPDQPAVGNHPQASPVGAWPGRSDRERAGFEVRDVHPTHYGRICPIETPEGPNIGLINSLATYAKVNKYGFIETPYRLVENGQVTGGLEDLSAMEEDKLVVAQADAPRDAQDRLTEDLVSVRKQGDFRAGAAGAGERD